MRTLKNRMVLMLMGVVMCGGVLALVAARPAKRGAPAAAGSVQAGRIAHPAIAEASGVVASRRYAGVLWTHNDRGNTPTLYAIMERGELIREYRIPATNDDWEDIAIDDSGRIYIGQIGNNDAANAVVQVLCVAEPDPFASEGGRGRSRLAVEWRVQLTYPDGPFDSEGLFVHGGHGYLISKLKKRQPAGLYRFPLTPRDEPVVLEKIADLPIQAPVTGADLSPDGARLAVVSLAGLDVFQVDGNPAHAASAPRRHYPLSRPHDFEGCCFTARGILLVAESREMRLFPDGPIP